MVNVENEYVSSVVPISVMAAIFNIYQVDGCRSINSTNRCSFGDIFDDIANHSLLLFGRYLIRKYLISHPFTSH